MNIKQLIILFLTLAFGLTGLSLLIFVIRMPGTSREVLAVVGSAFLAGGAAVYWEYRRNNLEEEKALGSIKSSLTPTGVLTVGNVGETSISIKGLFSAATERRREDILGLNSIFADLESQLVETESVRGSVLSKGEELTVPIQQTATGIIENVELKAIIVSYDYVTLQKTVREQKYYIRLQNPAEFGVFRTAGGGLALDPAYHQKRIEMAAFVSNFPNSGSHNPNYHLVRTEKKVL